MTSAVQRVAVVGSDGTVAIEVPELAPGQRVRVTVEPTATAKRTWKTDQPDGLADERFSRATEQIDTYLRAAREALDD